MKKEAKIKPFLKWAGGKGQLICRTVYWWRSSFI